MDCYRALFESLLTAEAVDITLIEKARLPLRIIRSELSKKYKVFFLAEGRDKPTEVMETLQKYIDRILKKTEHLSTRQETSSVLISPLRKIDSALEQLGRRMNGDADASFQSALSEISLSASFIGRISDATSSQFLDSASTMSSISRAPKMQVPWFNAPLFADYNFDRNRLHEYSTMIEARYREALKIDESKGGGIVDAYGEKDVLTQQIATDKERVRSTEARLTGRSTALTELKAFVASLETDGFDTRDGAQLFARLLADLDKENNELLEAERLQKQEGSRLISEELDRLQNLQEKHERLLRQIAADRLRLRGVDAEEAAMIKQNRDLQADTDTLAGQIEELVGAIAERKERIVRNNRKIEKVNMEIEKFKWEVENMAASEERHRQKIELKIADVEDETAELDRVRIQAAAELEELKRRQHELEEEIIPELEYQIDKWSSELGFQVQQSARWKDTVDTLIVGAMSSHLRASLDPTHASDPDDP
jgi:hypothetical protein